VGNISVRIVSFKLGFQLNILHSCNLKSNNYGAMVLPIHLVDETVALKIYIGQHSQHNQMVNIICKAHAALQVSWNQTPTCYML
jgi:hypothetical protein